MGGSKNLLDILDEEPDVADKVTPFHDRIEEWRQKYPDSIHTDLMPLWKICSNWLDEVEKSRVLAFYAEHQLDFTVEEYEDFSSKFNLDALMDLSKVCHSEGARVIREKVQMWSKLRDPSSLPYGSDEEESKYMKEQIEQIVVFCIESAGMLGEFHHIVKLLQEKLILEVKKKLADLSVTV